MSLTKNLLYRNEMWCAADIHNYTCHICAKGFLDSNFNKAVIDKISNFYKIAPNFTYSQQGGSRTTCLACFRDHILLQSL